MTFSLKSIIWELFGYRDGVKDINPIGGKGFNQRFNELLADDLDNNELDKINNIVGYTQDPRTALQKLLVYLEEEFGGMVYISNATAIRRKVLLFAREINKRRGTFSGYQILLQIIGFQTVTITELNNISGFDSATTFDSAVRIFDQKCNSCGRYTIALTGTITLTPLINSYIINAINYNQPINATLEDITYNGTSIYGQLQGFWLQENGHLFLQENGGFINIE